MFWEHLFTPRYGFGDARAKNGKPSSLRLPATGDKMQTQKRYLVKRIMPEGVAGADGRIKAMSELTHVNGSDVSGLSLAQVRLYPTCPGFFVACSHPAYRSLFSALPVSVSVLTRLVARSSRSFSLLCARTRT